MNEYLTWLSEQIDKSAGDKDLQREHWAFCKAYGKVRELCINSESKIYSDSDVERAYSDGQNNRTFRKKNGSVILPRGYQGVDG